MSFSLANLLQNMINHLSSKNTYAHWYSRFPRRCLALLSHSRISFGAQRCYSNLLEKKSLISVSKIVQTHAGYLPKSMIRCGFNVLFFDLVMEVPYTVAWYVFLMHLIIYTLLGHLSAEASRGICWVNQLSPASWLVLFSGGMSDPCSFMLGEICWLREQCQHTVIVAQNKRRPSNRETQACEFFCTHPQWILHITLSLVKRSHQYIILNKENKGGSLRLHLMRIWRWCKGLLRV